MKELQPVNVFIMLPPRRCIKTFTGCSDLEEIVIVEEKDGIEVPAEIIQTRDFYRDL